MHQHHRELQQEHEQQHQPQQSTRSHNTPQILLQLFSQQSENCEVLIGRIKLTAKQETHPPKMLLQLRGYYRIYSQPKKEDHNSTESHIDITETLNEFDSVVTKRLERQNTHTHRDGLEREECFLEGVQRISVLHQQKVLAAGQAVVYPFLFNLPASTPPSVNKLWFANKRIQIKYYLSLKSEPTKNKDKIPEFEPEFQITLRQQAVAMKPNDKFCNLMRYKCFSRFFCKCLGTYHVEVSASVLHGGQLQIEGRVFREGKRTEKVVTGINIVLMGELKGVKKMRIAQRKMHMHENQYQMLQGQILLGYDPHLRSFTSQLITIRFWIECQLQFAANVWKYAEQQTISDVIL